MTNEFFVDGFFTDGFFDPDFFGTPTPLIGVKNMSIDFRKYVRIISGVGGAASVSVREFIGRLFSNNALLSPDSVYEFTSSDDVGNFFGFASEEYLRAVFYFGWVSPNITQARKISFARYTSGAIAPQIIGGRLLATLAQLQAITAGLITVKTPAHPTGLALTAISFAAAGSYGAVAAALQAKFAASGDAMLATATVTYDAVNQRFVIVGGVTGIGSLGLVQVGAGNTDVANLMALYISNGAADTTGSAAQSPSTALSNSIGISTNFGSFLFMPRGSISVANNLDAATYNATQNNMYMHCWPTLSTDAVAVNAAALAIPGVAATLYDAAYPFEYDEMIPMIQMAATDYTRRKGVSNYMYKAFAITPKVLDDTASGTYDALLVNYYGQTQINGQQRSFYQDGLLFGTTTSPRDQSVFANEAWLKDNITVGFFDAFFALPEIPSNAEGRGICRGIIQTAVNAGLRNGVISVDKTFTNLQQSFITQQTGDANAWRTVQGKGYWYDVTINPVVENGVTTYVATYLLIYGKDDAIHRVEGTHALI